MQILNITNYLFNSQIQSNRSTTNLRLKPQLSKDTVSFKGRTYDNNNPNTQLYRGVGATEIKALCEGKTIEGVSYATSDPRGYRGCNWASGGGYGEYYITFNKNKITFRDHRDYDEDTRYLVNEYNLADVETIRKGQNNHGELIYSMDLENGKKNDILAKQKDIRDILVSLQSGKLTKEEKEASIDNLKSYSKEFPMLNEAIEVANSTFGHRRLKIKEEYLTPLTDANEDKGLIELVKSMTSEKVEEFGKIRDIKKHSRIINGQLDLVSDEAYSKYDWTETIKELQSEMENIKAKLKALMALSNKDNVFEFEIKSLSQILDRYKTIFK